MNNINQFIKEKIKFIKKKPLIKRKYFLFKKLKIILNIELNLRVMLEQFKEYKSRIRNKL